MVIFVRSNLKLIVACILGFALTYSRMLFGQDVVPDTGGPTPGTGWQVLLTIVYYGGGAAVVFGVGWGLTKLAGWINENHKNALWAGFVVRFVQALDDAFESAWEKFKAKLAEAMDPASEGGRTVTDNELDGICDDMIQYLKDTYASWAKLTSLVGRVIGGDAEEWIKTKVKRKAKAGVAAKLRGPRIGGDTVNP